VKYIITGTSSGLGYALLKKLIPHGRVAGISRSIGKAKSLHLVDKFLFIKHDLSESCGGSQYSCLVERLKDFVNGDLFTLIFNAARFYSSPYRLNQHLLQELFEVNLFSTMNLTRDLQMAGLTRILFINSISGTIGQEFQHEYAASKHALMGFARSLAKSAKRSNFDVMSINPGGMSTELWEHYGNVDCTDFLCPERVADVCIALLMLPQGTFIDNMSILPTSDV